MDDYQAELNGLTLGEGTQYLFEGITGLGVPAPRTSDLDLPTGGTLGGRDLPAVRRIGLAVVLVPGDTDLMELVADLNDAWAPASDDTTLSIQLPGMDLTAWTGRPRGVDLDLSGISFGWARARLVFDALDPDGFSP